MQKEIFNRNGIGYFFNWYMSDDKYTQNSNLIIMDGDTEIVSPIDDNWVNLRDTSMRWIFSNRVKESMKKLVFDKARYFTKLVVPNKSKDKKLKETIKACGPHVVGGDEWNYLNFPSDGSKPYGSFTGLFLTLTNKLNLELIVIKGKDWNECTEKMRSGEIDLMTNLGDKDDRRDYIELIPYVQCSSLGWTCKGDQNIYFGISKKSKFISRIAEFKSAILSDDDYVKIYNTDFTSADQHDWGLKINISDFIVSNMQMKIDNKCLVNTYSKDKGKEVEKLNRFFKKLEWDKSIRSSMGDSMYRTVAIDCDPEICNNFSSCPSQNYHICRKYPETIIMMENFRENNSQLYFQYDKCNSKFKFIYPKFLFSDNFDEAYVTFLKWKEIALEKNITHINIEMFKRDNVRYIFNSINKMGDFTGMLWLHLIHPGYPNRPLSTVVDENWIPIRDKGFKWFYSSKVQDFVKTKLALNQETLFE
jgi:hypothetical protein